MSTNNPLCDFPYCRGEPAVTYCGKGLCPKHWQQVASSEGPAEQTLLEQIGLSRNADGEVGKKKN